METEERGPAPGAGSIHIGVAGWSYPDWRGTFYPARRDARQDLARVARLFDCVEVNLPFYRMPEPRLAEGWVRLVQDRPGFLFTSKVPKELTHEKGLGAEDLSRIAAGLKEGLRPLAEAGRLAAVLLQFPFYFRDGTESRERIRRLVEELRPLPTSVEVRSPGFFFGPRGDPVAAGGLVRDAGAGEDRGASPGRPLATGPGSAIRFLEEIGAGIVNIDLPRRGATVPPTSINTSATGYVRLHGRNAVAWFDPKAGRDEKYSYLYSLPELIEWKERIVRLGERTARTFVIMNNHFKAQAPANALQLLHLLGRTPEGVPPELLAAYPDLEKLLGGPSTGKAAPAGGGTA
jgi:uncharacterized protein YecE (DUF72 family)